MDEWKNMVEANMNGLVMREMVNAQCNEMAIATIEKVYLHM